MCQLQNLFLVYKLRKQKNGTLISFPLVPLCFYFTFHKLIQALMLSSHGPREQLLAFKSNQTPPLRQLQKKTSHLNSNLKKKQRPNSECDVSQAGVYFSLLFSRTPILTYFKTQPQSDQPSLLFPLPLMKTETGQSNIVHPFTQKK